MTATNLIQKQKRPRIKITEFRIPVDRDPGIQGRVQGKPTAIGQIPSSDHL